MHNLFENLYFYLSKVEPLSDSQKSLNELLGGSSILNQESFSINLLNIYLVSVLETYFKRTFVNLLKCLNPVAFVSIRNSTNIPRYAQAEYISGQIDEYQMVAAGYSFQKINNIVNTYNNCFSVDLMVVLSKRADRNKTKYQIFEELFASRHGNVHKPEYNYSKLKDFIKKASIIAKSLNQIYGYLCKCYNVKRVEDYLYRTDFENNMKMIKTNHSSEVLR